jgi:hypothetical protein
LAAAASWKTRQMPALRSRIEISNDRRSHVMVLRALPEKNLINTCFTEMLSLSVKPLKRLIDHRYWDTGLKTGVNEIPSGGEVLRRQIISA